MAVLYPEAVDFMERRVNDISNGIAPETVWILEHDSIYTAGTSAKDEDLLAIPGVGINLVKKLKKLK